MAGFGKKSKAAIELKVDLDTLLSQRDVAAVTVEVLKYILYQRHQVPLQVQLLQQEVQTDAAALQLEQENMSNNNRQPADNTHMNDDNHSHGPADSNPKQTLQNIPASVQLRNNLRLVKKRQDTLQAERRWKCYFGKVEKFVAHFNSITTALERELCSSSGVCAIRLALGSSFITAREVYTLKLPHPPPHETTTKTLPFTNKRTIISKLFRSFITNEALSSLVNKPCGATKVWLLVLKPRRGAPSTSDSSCMSASIASEQQDRGNQQQQCRGAGAPGRNIHEQLSWFPRPNYELRNMSQQVNVNLINPPAPPAGTQQQQMPSYSTPCLARTSRSRRLLPSLAKRGRPTPFSAVTAPPSKKGREQSPPSAQHSYGESLMRDLHHFELTPLDSSIESCSKHSESGQQATASDVRFSSPDMKQEPFLKPSAPVRRTARQPPVPPHALHSPAPPGNLLMTPARDADYTVLDMVESPFTSCAGQQTYVYSGPVNHETLGFLKPRSVQKTHSPISNILSRTSFITPSPINRSCSRSASSTCRKVVPMVETPTMDLRCHERSKQRAAILERNQSEKQMEQDQDELRMEQQRMDEEHNEQPMKYECDERREQEHNERFMENEHNEQQMELGPEQQITEEGENFYEVSAAITLKDDASNLEGNSACPCTPSNTRLVDMIETPVVESTRCWNTNSILFPKTGTDYTEMDMVETPVVEQPLLPEPGSSRPCSSRRLVHESPSSQVGPHSEDGVASTTAWGEAPPGAASPGQHFNVGALATSLGEVLNVVREEQSDNELMWYQLSAAMIGFKERPVANPRKKYSQLDELLPF